MKLWRKIYALFGDEQRFIDYAKTIGITRGIKIRYSPFQPNPSSPVENSMCFYTDERYNEGVIYRGFLYVLFDFLKEDQIPTLEKLAEEFISKSKSAHI